MALNNRIVKVVQSIFLQWPSEKTTTTKNSWSMLKWKGSSLFLNQNHHEELFLSLVSRSASVSTASSLFASPFSLKLSLPLSVFVLFMSVSIRLPLSLSLSLSLTVFSHHLFFLSGVCLTQSQDLFLNSFLSHGLTFLSPISISCHLSPITNPPPRRRHLFSSSL